MSYIVAIVGRPNVGKSTLFNRLTETKNAITHSTSGVTRDRIYGKVIWNNTEFSLIDTGGYNINENEDNFVKLINLQVEAAIQNCDSIIFLIDSKTELTLSDQTILEKLRKSGKKIYLCINKIDSSELHYNSYEYFKLGFKKIFSLSGMNGYGTGELLDEIILDCKVSNKTVFDEFNAPKIAIVGKPNVGKSTLLNALIGEERSIVSNIPGTTRDATHSIFNKFDVKFNLIDTAGIRKKSKVHEDLEFYSTLRTIKAIEQSDVCLLLIDATEGITSQDVDILETIRSNRKGVLILINKWDLINDKENEFKKKTIIINEKIKPLTDIPIIFISALEKSKLIATLKEAQKVYENKTQQLNTKELNNYLLPIISNTPPPVEKRKRVKVKFISQLKNVDFPAIIFYSNYPEAIKEPYKRFIEKKIREKYNFSGCSIAIIFREK